MNVRTPIGIWLLLVAAGCAPTETGNPPEPGRVVLGVTSSDPEAVGVTQGAATVTVESAWHGILRVGYLSCDGEPAYLVEESRAVDLVSGLGVGIGGEVPAGAYCNFLLPTGPVPAEGAPEALFEYAFLMTGTRSDGRAFEVVGDDIAIESEFTGGALERTPDSPPVLLNLDLALLYPRLEVERTEPGADGVVRVDKSLTGDPGTFHADWQSSWTLYSDDNRNGRVDAEDTKLF